MDWTSLITTLAAAAIGGALPAVIFTFRVGQKVGEMIQTLKDVVDRCEHRAVDHNHHYEKIHAHEVKIGQIDTRVGSLESWRTKVDT